MLDVNGTLSLDGELVAGVHGRLRALRAKLDVHLLSADTYGRLDAEMTTASVAAAERFGLDGEAAPV